MPSESARAPPRERPHERLMSADARAAREKTRRRGPRRATRTHLENAALYYLARFATSAANLRRVLMRRVERSSRFHGTDAEEGARWVDEIVARAVRSGLVDDRAYAEGRALTLFRRGASLRAIRAALTAKGVGDDDIERALARLAEEAPRPDLAAARNYARRRGLGPYRPADGRRARREKDLAALARAGFDYDTARRVVEAEDAAALEAMVESGEG